MKIAEIDAKLAIIQSASDIPGASQYIANLTEEHNSIKHSIGDKVKEVGVKKLACLARNNVTECDEYR